MIAGGEESNRWSTVWYPLEAPSPDVHILVYVCCDCKFFSSSETSVPISAPFQRCLLPDNSDCTFWHGGTHMFPS